MGVDTNRTRTLLKRWCHQLSEAVERHRAASMLYRRRHFALGVPATLLTAGVGCTAFATLGFASPLWVQIALGTLSVLASILVAVLSFLRLMAESERHRLAAAQYEVLIKRIELLLLDLPESRKGRLEAFSNLLNGFENINSMSPVVAAPMRETRSAASACNWGQYDPETVAQFPLITICAELSSELERL